MITEKITYTDFNGNERTEEFLFNLTKTELLELAMELPEGLADSIVQEKDDSELKSATLIMAALGSKGVNQFFKSLILKSYGVKSLDGKRFEKSEKLSTEFSQSPAFDELYFGMITDANKAAEFVNNLIPESLLKNATAAGAPNLISNV